MGIIVASSHFTRLGRNVAIFGKATRIPEATTSAPRNGIAPRKMPCMGTSRARGRPGIRSERWQTCQLLGQRTLFSNHERFSGPLAPLVYALYARKLRRAFRLYGLDLQARVEELAELAASGRGHHQEAREAEVALVGVEAGGARGERGVRGADGRAGL